MFKYTLIVSQYYHSRHFFIVEHTSDFIEKAQKFTKELCEYKRGDKPHLYEIRLGDLEPKYLPSNGEIRWRYNVNDTGDIYFLQSNYANYLAGESREYLKDTIRESKGYQKKAVVEDISKHHFYDDVKKIVEKHFTIV